MLDILRMRSSEAGADLCKIESWNAEAISSKSNILLSIFSSDGAVSFSLTVRT